MSVVVLTSHQQLLIESTRIVSLRRCRNRLNYPWINPEWKPCARFPMDPRGAGVIARPNRDGDRLRTETRDFYGFVSAGSGSA